MVQSYELVELAGHLCGINGDDLEDEWDVWNKVWEKYEIDEENFGRLISDLLPLVQVGKSLIDARVSKGFGRKNGKIIEMLVKIEV